MSNEKKEREKEVISFKKQGIDQLANQAMLQAMLIPFIQKLEKAIRSFDKSTERYSKRMEKLSVAMLILAAAEVLVAIVTVALVVL